MASRGGGGACSIDDLIALNDEIVALVRAGVPIERGLIGFGRDLRGRLGRLAEGVGRRMDSEGCSLAEAVGAEAGGMPELYRAVIEAGLRSGRLTSALEGLTTFARGRAELRRAIDLALIYPAIVIVVAYGLFVAFVVLIAPGLDAGFQSLGVAPGSASLLARLGESAAIWGPMSLAVMVGAAFFWRRSGRASMLGSRGGGLVSWIPGVRKLLDLARSGMYAELLALLIENEMPMPEALALSARAVGDPNLERASDRVAGAIRRGDDVRSALPKETSGAFPPMLRWLILFGSAQGSLPQSLRIAAKTYRDRATFRADMVRLFVPMALTVGLGGGAVLLYGLTLFAPFAELLNGLA